MFHLLQRMPLFFVQIRCEVNTSLEQLILCILKYRSSYQQNQLGYPFSKRLCNAVERFLYNASQCYGDLAYHQWPNDFPNQIG